MRGIRSDALSRRGLLLSAGALSLVAASGSEAVAQEKPVSATEFDIALKKILGGVKPSDGKLTFEVPEIAENGNTVPYSLSLESPMTERDYVKTLHVLSTGNPQPGIASFSLTPASGRAFVASRMRLARTQDVVALAELSDGRFLMAKKSVKVTIGGCGG